MNGSHTSGPSQGSRKAPGKRPGGRKAGKSGLSAAQERSVRRLRLSKALTLADTTTVADACRRMASRRVDACLLTDSNAILCGIMTDKDLALKCVGEGLDVNTTLVSQIMTRNPIFVNVDSSAVDALQKMVQGRFRHLPVIENGEVVALLSITKCLYDAIARMERAVEKGNAIAAAIEGIEQQWGGSTASGFINTFRDKIFKPTLATIIGDSSQVPRVVKGDSVLTACRKMKLARTSAAIVTNGLNNKPVGILTSKDILTRVLALSLKPGETSIEKVMTPNPECVSQDITIVDALHAMHDGKFLHLPVVDRDGNCVAVVDVMELTQGAMSMAAGSGADATEASNQLMQRFWDSALALEPADPEEADTASIRSGDVGDMGAFMRSKPGSIQGDDVDAPFLFKMEDSSGRTHRFMCSPDSMTELVCAIAARLDGEFDPDNPPSIMYEDEEGDKVVISVDEDLTAAVKFARARKLKGLKLILDFEEDGGQALHWHAQRKGTAHGKPPRGKPKGSQGGYGAGASRGRKGRHDEDNIAAYESSMRAYTWAMVGVTVVALASVGVAVYVHRSK